MTRHRTRGWVVTVMASITLVLTLALLPSAGGATGGQAARVALDVRPLGKPAALAQCATKRFVDGRPGRVRVRYGMQQRTPSGVRGSFVLRNHAGRVLFCDMFGRDRPATLPLPRTTARRVAVHATNPDLRAICRDGIRTGVRYAAFLRVQDPVRSARTRFWVDGVAQPWFTSRRQGRFVHLQSWHRGLPEGAALRLQTQLRGSGGTVLNVPGLPGSPRRVVRGCVQIG